MGVDYSSIWKRITFLVQPAFCIGYFRYISALDSYEAYVAVKQQSYFSIVSYCCYFQICCYTNNVLWVKHMFLHTFGSHGWHWVGFPLLVRSDLLGSLAIALTCRENISACSVSTKMVSLCTQERSKLLQSHQIYSGDQLLCICALICDVYFNHSLQCVVGP